MNAIEFKNYKKKHKLKCIKPSLVDDLYIIIKGNSKNHVAYSDLCHSKKEAWSSCFQRLNKGA